MRVIVCSFLALTLSLFSEAMAESSLDASAKKQLAQLERRYFGHTFESDADEDRAGRIEKLVFGDINEGTPQERISKIVAISPPEEALPEPEKPAASTNSKAGARAKQPAAKNEHSNSAASKPVSRSLGEEDSLELRDYPHIAELEKAILGKTYAGTPLSARLCNLESKAFGTPSNLPDFSERTDALDDYAEKTLHIKRANPDDSAAPGVAPAIASQPEYPHITALESAILGQNYAGQALSARISRMESSAFGTVSTDPDLSKRTDALERYAEKTLHKKPLVAQQGNDTASSSGAAASSSSKSKQVLSMVGNTLLGVSGFGGLAGMGGPGYGMGGMGMGPKVGPMRFGGMRLRGQAPSAQSPEPEPDDDPAVTTPYPPPASAQLLTKVGWCEVQVFGHTFLRMHLTDRLRQLSKELQFNTSKSDLDLMDDVGAMVKTVQARQKPATPIGTTTQTPVH